LFSVQLGRWWVIGDVEIGPHHSLHCFGAGECQRTNLLWVGGGDRWMRLGMATWASGLVAALMLVIMAARLAAKRVPKLVAKSVLVAITTAMVTGTIFLATFPGIQGASIARGAAFFLLGAVLALAAAITVLTMRRDS
jgi:hypothetical protein